MTTAEQRLYDLSQRLLCWEFAGDEIPEVFTEAGRKFQEMVTDYEDFNQLPPDVLLTIFEETMNHFDNILKNFPISHE